ncbi:hypothetical protein IFM46972_01722 [Aspergillus udagawae]|uniref:Uncharacterized protein n=1 Tax=Aspergillus udagawae TaxID=91492 RepID=A0A8H3RJ11_9EURO|nr:hypothetical protein IFM46972_01722 [Aspergillus udagawae]
MHLSPWAFATFITAATAATLQVNYYSDGGCSNYMTELKPSPSPTTCVDYVWGGSNSMNIAACTFPNGKCICTVYTQPHLQRRARPLSKAPLSSGLEPCRPRGPVLQGIGGRLWNRVVIAQGIEDGFSWHGDGGEELGVILPLSPFFCCTERMLTCF